MKNSSLETVLSTASLTGGVLEITNLAFAISLGVSHSSAIGRQIPLDTMAIIPALAQTTLTGYMQNILDFGNSLTRPSQTYNHKLSSIKGLALGATLSTGVFGIGYYVGTIAGNMLNPMFS